jgi:hypothetical protein
VRAHASEACRGRYPIVSAHPRADKGNVSIPESGTRHASKVLAGGALATTEGQASAPDVLDAECAPSGRIFEEPDATGRRIRHRDQTAKSRFNASNPSRAEHVRASEAATGGVTESATGAGGRYQPAPYGPRSPTTVRSRSTSVNGRTSGPAASIARQASAKSDASQPRPRSGFKRTSQLANSQNLSTSFRETTASQVMGATGSERAAARSRWTRSPTRGGTASAGQSAASGPGQALTLVQEADKKSRGVHVTVPRGRYIEMANKELWRMVWHCWSSVPRPVARSIDHHKREMYGV